MIAADIEIPSGIFSENKYLNTGDIPLNISVHKFVIIKSIKKTASDLYTFLRSSMGIALYVSLKMFLCIFSFIFSFILDAKPLNILIHAGFEEVLSALFPLVF